MRYWPLGVGYWVLGVGYWALGFRMNSKAQRHGGFTEAQSPILDQGGGLS